MIMKKYMNWSEMFLYDSLKKEEVFKRFDAICKRKDYQTFVAVHNNKVIGFIGLCKGIAFNIEGEYIQIIAFAVNKYYQNKGIGTKLLEKAEQYAQKGNIGTLCLHSGFQRQKAHAFYERKGYIKRDIVFKNLFEWL